MSYIVSFKTDEFVLMAGDKRETFVDGSGYIDGIKKVFKVNNYIYGFTGSKELSKIFRDSIKSVKELSELIKLTDKFFNMLESSKEKYEDNWRKQQFTFTLQIAGISNNNTKLYVYQTKWNEDGYNKADYKDLSTEEIPCYVSPLDLDEECHDYIEKYIQSNHAKTIEGARQMAKNLMKLVNARSNEVSLEYDIEFLEIAK